MFEVTRYEHPYIFVTSRRTGETYRLLVGAAGTLVEDGPRFDAGEARRKASQYLFNRRFSTQLAEPLRLSA